MREDPDPDPGPDGSEVNASPTGVRGGLGRDGVPCWMVVIVLVVGREGPETSSRRVSFVSYVNVNQQFRSAQVEPGETVATTKEGE